MGYGKDGETERRRDEVGAGGELQAERHPEGAVVFATLEWVCEACHALNLHDYPQDGRVRAIVCQACRTPGCLIVPSGRGMLPEKAAGMYVVCDDCGAQRDPSVKGCWNCAGLGHEPAEGRVVKPRARNPLTSCAAQRGGGL